MINWQAEAKEIKKAIMKDGASGVVFTETAGEYDPVTGRKTIVTGEEYPVACFIRNFDQPDSVNILVTDLKVMAVATKTDPGFHMLTNLKITLPSGTYQVLNTLPAMPGGVVLYYEFQCRS